MKNYRYILTLGLLAGLASCSNDDFQGSEAQDGIKTFSSFYATVADAGADTRSHLENDKKIVFDANDKISLFVDGDYKHYYSYTYGSSNTFEGGPVSGKSFLALFPAGGFLGSNETNMVYQLEDEVTYQPGSYSQPMPMIAKSESDNHLAFYHAAGLIKISLTGTLKVKSLILTGNNGEQIAGLGEIDVEDDKPVMEMVDYYEGYPALYTQNMTVSGGVTLSSTPTDFYFVVPAMTFSKGISVEVFTEELTSSILKTTDNAVSIGRGVIKTFSSVDADGMLKAEADQQLEVLKALYNAADGANWAHKDNWMSDQPVSSWYGVTADGYGMITKLDLSGNNLSGPLPETLGDLRVLTDLNLSGNNLTGNVPSSVINMTYLQNFDISGNQMNGFVPEEVFTTTWWANLTKSLTQQAGFELAMGYVSSDFSKDGLVKKLQTHTEGGGIPIVITCDGFSDRMVSDFDVEAAKAKDYFFSIEPYKSFKNYFDVYSLMAVSVNERVGQNTAYGTTINEETNYTPNSAKIRAKLEATPETGNVSAGILTIVLLNVRSESVIYRAICNFVSDGFAAAIIPVDEDMESVIHHEAGGHGFAFLGDEYDSDDPGETTFTDTAFLDAKHAVGFYLNLDYHNTAETVLWTDFLGLPDYVNTEQVGIYEGAMAVYKKGVYRCTEESTMNDNFTFDKFNPQSRWLIYKQIMKRAGLAEPTFEQFKAYDAPNIIAPPIIYYATTRSGGLIKKHKRGAPPIITIK